jgi:hypothetical protein
MLFGEKLYGETSFRGISGKSCLGNVVQGMGAQGIARGTV